MAQTYNLTIVKGSDTRLRLSATNSDGSVISLSGYSVRGMVRMNYSDASGILNLNPTIYSAVSGLVDINLSGSVTSQLPVFVGPYEVETYISGVGGNTESAVKLLRGYCEILPEACY